MSFISKLFEKDNDSQTRAEESCENNIPAWLCQDPTWEKCEGGCPAFTANGGLCPGVEEPAPIPEEPPKDETFTLTYYVNGQEVLKARCIPKGGTRTLVLTNNGTGSESAYNLEVPSPIGEEE